jgi:hypothetical protein
MNYTLHLTKEDERFLHSLKVASHDGPVFTAQEQSALNRQLRIDLSATEDELAQQKARTEAQRQANQVLCGEVARLEAKAARADRERRLALNAAWCAVGLVILGGLWRWLA